jgi:hypothetical protein
MLANTSRYIALSTKASFGTRDLRPRRCRRGQQQTLPARNHDLAVAIIVSIGVSRVALLMPSPLNCSPLLANIHMLLPSGSFLPTQVWVYLFDRVGAGLLTTPDYIIGPHLAGLGFAFAGHPILDGNVE